MLCRGGKAVAPSRLFAKTETKLTTLCGHRLCVYVYYNIIKLDHNVNAYQILWAVFPVIWGSRYTSIE